MVEYHNSFRMGGGAVGQHLNIGEWMNGWGESGGEREIWKGFKTSQIRWLE